MEENEVKKAVRAAYARVAKRECHCSAPSEGEKFPEEENRTPKQEGQCCTAQYTAEDLLAAPTGANLGLGCGNPIASAALKEGEAVLDLGSGTGMDCFLAAKRVGERGKVIGVDMTPEMLDAAREIAQKHGYSNVEFRLGEIENLPLPDGSVDVIISNCVINLSPDKERVFRESFRVLKPGGRIVVSDIVLLEELPAYIRNSKEAYVGCLAGASLKENYLSMIRQAGFEPVEVLNERQITSSDPAVRVISMQVRALKPTA